MNQPTTHPKRQAIAADLRQAQQNGELEVFYQPQVDLGTGLLIGAEALLRWNHPEKGQLTPDQFLPVAEESGLIVDIGEWVLHNACRTAVDWNQDRRRVLTIAVNLSPHQFGPNDLLASVCRTLQITGCEAEWLTLEVTEALLQHDNGAACETLEQLRDLGISIVIDDFGKGTSLLSPLKRFPVDSLKIDRFFIRNMKRDSENTELIKAIIALGSSLNMSLMAEGVEDPSQEEMLQRYGCHSAQGYLYGRPMTKETFEQLLFDTGAAL